MLLYVSISLAQRAATYLLPHTRMHEAIGFRPSVSLSVSLPVCQSVSLSVCQSVCQSVSQSVIQTTPFSHYLLLL